MCRVTCVGRMMFIWAREIASIFGFREDAVRGSLIVSRLLSGALVGA